jgi:hypothetical protein
MDKRLNATKNKGRNKRDMKVTKRRIEGTSATTMQQAPDVSSPTLRRSLQGDRSVPQSPGMWNHIAEGGLLQDQDIHKQGDADEEASMNTMCLLGQSNDSFRSCDDSNQSDSSLDVDPVKTLTEAGAILEELEQHICK